MRLSERRILVVGASSGLGRATAVRLCREGARVAFAGRRVDRLEQAVAEAVGKESEGGLPPGGAHAVACDVRDEASCEAVVRESVAILGGLDALVYAAGMGRMRPLVEVDAEAWREVLETNLIGASLVTRAAIRELEATRGRAVYFSSISTTDQPPRRAHAPYVVSKVALERLVEAWQNEHRKVAFTRVVMGDSLSEFGAGEDPQTMAEIVAEWAGQGYMYGRVMEPEATAEQVVSVLASAETVRAVFLTPSYAE